MCLKLAKKIIPTDRPELNEELQAEKRDTKQVLSLFSLFPLSQRAAQLQDRLTSHAHTEPSSSLAFPQLLTDPL